MEIPVIKTVEREVVKEVPVERIVWKDREVPVERVVTKEVPVMVDRIVERFTEIPVERIVYKEVPVEVERIIRQEVPVPYEVKAEPEIVQVIKEVRRPASRALWEDRSISRWHAGRDSRGLTHYITGTGRPHRRGARGKDRGQRGADLC
jgi:hypothetical protein